MRRILLVLSAGAFMAAVLVVIVSSALAQAENGAVNETFPFTGEGINPCNGELYTVEGTLHVVNHNTADKSGSPHQAFHLNQQGQGVGESGAKYLFIATDNTNSNGEPFDPSADEQTVTLNTRIIRQGADGHEEDYMAHMTFHITQNANGEFTAEVEQIDVECR